MMDRMKESLHELKSVRVLTCCGLMAALAIALNFVASIDLGPYIRIGISGLPNQVVSFLFGPAVGAIFGAMLDIIKFLIKPTGPFFPGFTLSAALNGLIYGIFVYRKPLTVKRVLLAQLLIKIFVNIGLNTLWLKILYDKAILAILPGRLISNAVMLPIDTFLMFIILKMVERTVLPYYRDPKAEAGHTDASSSEGSPAQNTEAEKESGRDLG